MSEENMSKKLSDEPCDHPEWVRDPKSGDYTCKKCETSLDDMVANLTGIPSVPEKEPTVTMSVKSWENLDKDLSLTEHQLVSALTRVRVIRGQIHKSMKTWIEDHMEENLVRVTDLEESVKELRELVDEAKVKGEKKEAWAEVEAEKSYEAEMEQKAEEEKEKKQ